MLSRIRRSATVSLALTYGRVVRASNLSGGRHETSTVYRDQRLPGGRSRSEGMRQRRQGVGGRADRSLRLRSEERHDAARLTGDEEARVGGGRYVARRR